MIHRKQKGERLWEIDIEMHCKKEKMCIKRIENILKSESGHYLRQILYNVASTILEQKKYTIT